MKKLVMYFSLSFLSLFLLWSLSGAVRYGSDLPNYVIDLESTFEYLSPTYSESEIPIIEVWTGLLDDMFGWRLGEYFDIHSDDIFTPLILLYKFISKISLAIEPIFSFSISCLSGIIKFIFLPKFIPVRY